MSEMQQLTPQQQAALEAYLAELRQAGPQQVASIYPPFDLGRAQPMAPPGPAGWPQAPMSPQAAAMASSTQPLMPGGAPPPPDAPPPLQPAWFSTDTPSADVALPAGESYWTGKPLPGASLLDWIKQAGMGGWEWLTEGPPSMRYPEAAQRPPDAAPPPSAPLEGAQAPAEAPNPYQFVLPSSPPATQQPPAGAAEAMPKAGGPDWWEIATGSTDPGGRDWWEIGPSGAPMQLPDDLSLPATPDYGPEEPGYGDQMSQLRTSQAQMMEAIRQQIGQMGEVPEYPALDPVKISPIAAALSGLADLFWTTGRGISDPATLGFSRQLQRRETEERDKQHQAKLGAFTAEERARMRQLSSELGLSMAELEDSFRRQAALTSAQAAMERVEAANRGRQATAIIGGEYDLAEARIRASGRGGLGDTSMSSLITWGREILKTNQLTPEEASRLSRAMQTGDIATLAEMQQKYGAAEVSTGETPGLRAKYESGKIDVDMMAPVLAANMDPETGEAIELMIGVNPYNLTGQDRIDAVKMFLMRRKAAEGGYGLPAE